MSSNDRKLKLLLSMPFLSILVILGFIPVLFPVMSKYEGEWFPVILNTQVREVTDTEQGLVVQVEFDKIRSCEFRGILWNNPQGERATIVYPENYSLQPDGTVFVNDLTPAFLSRPAMRNQNAGRWLLINLHELRGSKATTVHRCHPLWLTYSTFYPNGA